MENELNCPTCGKSHCEHCHCAKCVPIKPTPPVNESMDTLEGLKKHKKHYYLDVEGHRYCIKCYALERIEPILSTARQEERERIYNYLMDKQEFVTYKKDNGHGVAVPMAYVIDLCTKLQEMR